VEEARAHDWQPLTARDHRSRAALIAADLGTVRLLDLDPLRIDAWLAQMRRRGVGDGAIRSRVSALKAACSWGVSRRMLRSNPVADATPRLSTGRRSVAPTPEQVVALLQAAEAEDARAGLGLRIAAVTGAREAEVVAHAWSDLTGAVLHVGRQRHSMGGQVLLRDRTKTGRDRSVLLDAGTVTAILTWKTKVEELVGAPTA